MLQHRSGVGFPGGHALSKSVCLFTVRPMQRICMEKSGVRAVNPGPFSSQGWHHYKLFDHVTPLHFSCNNRIAYEEKIFMLGGDLFLGHVCLAIQILGHNKPFGTLYGDRLGDVYMKIGICDGVTG